MAAGHGTNFTSLPSEIILNILKEAEVKDIESISEVCLVENTVLQHYNFLLRHIARSVR